MHLSMKCPTSPLELPGQVGDLPIGGTNSSPLGPKILANTPLLCILLGYYNLKKYINAPPLRPSEMVERHTNPHLDPGEGSGAFH